MCFFHAPAEKCPTRSFRITHRARVYKIELEVNLGVRRGFGRLGELGRNLGLHLLRSRSANHSGQRVRTVEEHDVNLLAEESRRTQGRDTKESRGGT